MNEIELFRSMVNRVEAATVEQKLIIANNLLCMKTFQKVKGGTSVLEELVRFSKVQGYFWYELKRSSLSEHVSTLLNAECKDLGWEPKCKLEAGIAWYTMYHSRQGFAQLREKTIKYLEIINNIHPYLEDLMGHGVTESSSGDAEQQAAAG